MSEVQAFAKTADFKNLKQENFEEAETQTKRVITGMLKELLPQVEVF